MPSDRLGHLAGRTAVITGASGGIGRAIALRLAKAGADIVVHYTNGSERAAETVRLVQEAGAIARCGRADLRDLPSVTAFVNDCGPFDILVNNAGVARGHALGGTTEEEFDAVFNTNVKGTFFLTQAAVPQLCDGGAIVNISSMVSLAAYPSTLPYSMSKAAINAFTRSLAADLAPRGITVNAVAPGATDSDFLDSLRRRPDAMAAVLAQTAFGRLGRPDEIAGVVEFLVSAAGQWVTGQVIAASGGMHL